MADIADEASSEGGVRKGPSERRRRNQRRQAVLASGFAAAALFSAVPAALIPLFDKFGIKIEPMEQTAAKVDTSREIASLRLELVQLKNDLAHLNVIVSDNGPAVSERVAIGKIESRLTDLEKRQGNMDRIILENPAKALELPLLKRDVETVKQSSEQAVAAVKQNVDQVYDLNKWLLGSMAVGVICLALSHFFRRKGE